MDKKIIVTGANGFIGSNLCKYLDKMGYDVHCLVREKSDLTLISKHLSDKIIFCDYLDIKEFSDILSEFDCIIHLAALTKAKKFDSFYETNVGLTDQIVKIVNKLKGVRQLIFISSQAALGPSKGKIPKNENDKEKPISWYGISKYLAEQKIKKCRKRWTIIRPSSVYGEGDKDFLAFFKLVNLHLSPTPGLEDKYISLIYIADLVQVIEKCILNVKVNKKIIHAADEKIYTMREFITTLSNAMDKICFRFRIPDNLIISVANIFDFIFNDDNKQTLFNKQKALELTQNSWLIDSSLSMELLDLKLPSLLYKNLKNTYLWYREHGYL